MNNDPIKHRPEYVILEPEESPQFQKEGGEEALRNLKSLGAKKFSWTVRLTVFIVLLFLIVILAVLALYLAACALFAGVTFFQSSALNERLNKAWNRFVNTLVVVLGFTVALFSPTFGFSIIMLHTLLHKGESTSFYTNYIFKL